MPEALLSTVQGQAVAVATIERALAASRVHHAYLFDGPDGVGKERAAFGLAQALVCSTPVSGTRLACGTCSACTRSLLREGERRPVHPDIVVLERGLYEPTTIGRRTPETQDLSIDQVRTLVLSRASFAPHEGRAKVFIVRNAEELSTGAANALLKTLEEPLDRTHFILLTSKPSALLSTIRSRTQRIRFAPLADATVLTLLLLQGVPPEAAQSAAKLSRGSMSRALLSADEAAMAERNAFVLQALADTASKTIAPALAMGELAKKLGREPLEAHLEALSVALGDSAREATFRGEHGEAVKAAERHAAVTRAVRQLDGNASAQLVVEALMIGIHD